jgi:hypothetical protein
VRTGSAYHYVKVIHMRLDGFDHGYRLIDASLAQNTPIIDQWAASDLNYC